MPKRCGDRGATPPPGNGAWTGSSSTLAGQADDRSVFGADRTIVESHSVQCAGTIVDVLIGVDLLRSPIDDIRPTATKMRHRMELKAPGIIPRPSVHEPVITGLQAVDSLISMGCG
jgi:F-type H+-transporting ATPase subunit alpha